MCTFISTLIMASYCLPMWPLIHLVTLTKRSLEITTPIKGLGTSSYAVDTLRDKNIWWFKHYIDTTQCYPDVCSAFHTLSF